MIENFIFYTQSIISEYGILGVLFATLIEQVIAPIPAPLVPIMAGFFLLPADSHVFYIIFQALYLIVIPVAIFSTFTSVCVYILGYIGGRPMIEKNKKWLKLNWQDVEKTEERLTRGKGDEIVLFVSRLLPVIPGFLISISCGIIRYSIKTYILYTFLGLFVRTLILSMIGWFAGEMYYIYIERIADIERSLFFVLIIGLIAFFIFRQYKKNIKK